MHGADLRAALDSCTGERSIVADSCPAHTHNHSCLLMTIVGASLRNCFQTFRNPRASGIEGQVAASMIVTVCLAGCFDACSN